MSVPDVGDDTEGPALCGDGVQQPGEACDDGNLVGGDGCEPDCTRGPVEVWCREFEGRGSHLAVSSWTGEVFFVTYKEGEAFTRKLAADTGEVLATAIDSFEPTSALAVGPSQAMVAHAMDVGPDSFLVYDLNVMALPSFGSASTTSLEALEDRVLRIGFGFGSWGAGAYAYNGDTLWGFGPEDKSYAFDITQDADTVYIVGGDDLYLKSGTKGLVTRHDASTGVPLGGWTVEAGDTTVLVGVAVDDAGNIHATGYAKLGEDSGSYMIVTQHSPDGELVYLEEVDTTDSGPNAKGLLIDVSPEMIVTTHQATDQRGLRVYDNDLTLLWHWRTPGMGMAYGEIGSEGEIYFSWEPDGDSSRVCRFEP